METLLPHFWPNTVKSADDSRKNQKKGTAWQSLRHNPCDLLAAPRMGGLQQRAEGHASSSSWYSHCTALKAQKHLDQARRTEEEVVGGERVALILLCCFAGLGEKKKKRPKRTQRPGFACLSAIRRLSVLLVLLSLRSGSWKPPLGHSHSVRVVIGSCGEAPRCPLITLRSPNFSIRALTHPLTPPTPAPRSTPPHH